MVVLSRLHQFAQPSEVTEPIELLRAGVIFHARGLINARAIQHNLDWVWPHWVERQFNPRDVAFVPRAFSITHVNLTHRNWTCVGLPGCDWLPIVDPRGLVTPTYDGWSLDAWVLLEDGRRLLPSRSDTCEQRLLLEDGGAPGVSVETRTTGDGAELHHRAEVVVESGAPMCRVTYRAQADADGFLALSLRPANPEGVSFIHEMSSSDGGRRLRINDEHELFFDTAPQRLSMSCYRQGDVLQDLTERTAKSEITCNVGLGTAAALFPLKANQSIEIEAHVPRPKSKSGEVCDVPGRSALVAWPEALAGHCQLQVPDRWMQFLYDAAVRNLILHSPGEVYPGPYTYKRFWFRDAAFILDAMLALGFVDRVRRCIELFPQRQTTRGYFLSQEGEWDSNGAAMWIMHRFAKVTGEKPPEAWMKALKSAAGWIAHKRVKETGKPHTGLLPAGFSAEHLGPNDYYFWDDFWSVAGLRGAAELFEEHGDAASARSARQVADEMMAAIDRAIEARPNGRSHKGVPASPYRRMDAGAIGSIAVGYPLQLWEAREPRLLDTVDFLLEYCTVHGGFFQDMIHSGINAYLTLEMAQVLMRADEGERAFELVTAVADLASPTGQWPEAIHPHTRGGCMGDGQHIWAAAEWVLAMRNLFVRPEGDTLVLGQGLPSAWLRPGQTLSLGPAPTLLGVVKVEVVPEVDDVVVNWEVTGPRAPRAVEVRLPGFASTQAESEAPGSVRVPRPERSVATERGSKARAEVVS